MDVKTIKTVFFWPIILGVLTLAGLTLALLEDGLLQSIALVWLSLPIGVCCILFKR